MGHVRRCRRRRIVEQFAENPRTAFHRARVLAVAPHGVNRRHAQEAAPRRSGRHRNPAELIALHSLETVIVGKQAVDDDVVSREQIAQGPVSLHEKSKRLVHLPTGRLLRAVVKLRIQREIKLEEIESIHRQPLGHKGLNEASRPRIIEQAVRLRLEHGWLEQGPALCKPMQLSVGRCAPQEVGKPCRHLQAT